MTELNSWCRMYYADLEKLDGFTFRIEYKRFGITIQKDAPERYYIQITGEGSHYSSTLKGLHPHIRKRLAHCLLMEQQAQEEENKN